ncbi:hypothetical protein BDF20DRAFT_879217 [Mycotypha africana]|uniref:uncharacterized protein n=1 Tax=Mycotypha africana TaxID=64632 RepID=UPI002300F00F|nr:uncharacterized protein BDF20DRAFT_879217 [Mycotypha africana]KAI8975535.1 hypothetical protein BDF20DRAFT_879217 [Mycotypha africana]
MTAYSLIDQSLLKKSARLKIVYFTVALSIAVTFTLIVISKGAITDYPFKVSDEPAPTSQEETVLPTEELVNEELYPIHTGVPPARSIHFTVPTQENPFYIDLDRYPIEDNVLQLFGMHLLDSIQAVTTSKLLKLQQQDIEPKEKSWADQWLFHHDGPISETTYACHQQPLPYPILRHLVANYLPLKNADRFFDDDSDKAGNDSNVGDHDNDYDTSIDFSKPFLFLPFSQKPMAPLLPGHKICVRAVIPFMDVGKDDPNRYAYKPYPDNNAKLTSPWWDTMHTTLRHMDTNASEPIRLQPWPGHRQLRQRARELRNFNNELPEWVHLRQDILHERERTHVYEIEITLPDQEGRWELSSVLEFVEARYNFEYGPVTPYLPVQIPVFPAGLNILTIQSKNSTKKPTLSDNEHTRTAEALLENHLSLPLCKGFDHSGRWLPYPTHSDKFTHSNHHNFISGLSRDGKYWAPYTCRHRHISYEQFNRCAAKKYPRGLHFYGDSNVRRSLKKFVSHGQWCKNWEQHITSPLLPEERKPHVDQSLMSSALVRRQEGYRSPQEYTYIEEAQTRSCYCEDYFEPYWNQAWFDPYERRNDLLITNNATQAAELRLTEWDDDSTAGDSPSSSAAVPSMDSVPISSWKWDGLTYLNTPYWDNAVPSSPAEADVAIFSLGNWDAAFGELEPYLRDAERLVRQIKEHYDTNKTKIIYRTAQYYCCRVDPEGGRQRQISGPRIDVFDEEVKTIFRNELDAPIWNTYALGEGKTYDEKLVAITCPSNHVTADQVEIENQLLMNGLCNL